MKERFLTVLKWFFMILGVLFLIQLLLIIGAFIGLFGFAKADVSTMGAGNSKIKEIQPIINYVEEYQMQNGKYPEKIENVKVKKGLNYKYEITKNANCYTITTKKEKDNLTTQYQHCKVSSKNSNSSSESYIEYNN